MACMRFGRRGPSWWFLRTTVSWSSRLLKLMKPNFPEHFLNSRHYPRQAFKWPQYGNQRMPTNGCKVLNFHCKAESPAQGLVGGYHILRRRMQFDIAPNHYANVQHAATGR